MMLLGSLPFEKKRNLMIRMVGKEMLHERVNT